MRMQVFRRRFVIAASLFLVLLVFPVFVNPTSVDGGGSPDCNNKGIYIKSNEDFRKYDFPGEGTEDKPFIIEGLQLEIKGFGIRIRGTTAHFIIRDSVFEGQSGGWYSTAVYLANVENGVIENCVFSGVNRGIGIHKSENIVIQGNEISFVRFGIRIKHSSSLLIMNNDITDSELFALFLAFSFDCTVTYNTIANNDGIGVFLYDSGSCTLFGNYFESNMMGNARDILGDRSATDTNLWDDDVSLGNDWDDYEGTGVYPISGDRGSVDRYPIGSDPDSVAPEWITAPIEQTIECGDTFKMVVEADDDSGISTYWIDDTDLFSIEFIDSSVDYKANITCNQPLAFGEYTVEVRAYDPFNNFCSATFTVIVQDTISPEIVGPADVTYKEGETGKNLEWSVSDLNPSSYAIFVDGVKVDDGLWNEPSGTIEISIDGLSAGEYKYRLEVYDLGENSASDEVTVKVEGKTPVPTTTPIPKPKTEVGGNPPTDGSMAGPYIEPVVVASGIGIPTLLGFAILFVIGKRREVA